MDKGFFGSVFNLNGDGKLDSFEQFLDYTAFTQMMEEEEEKDGGNDEDDADDDGDG